MISLAALRLAFRSVRLAYYMKDYLFLNCTKREENPSIKKDAKF